MVRVGAKRRLEDKDTPKPKKSSPLGKRKIPQNSSNNNDNDSGRSSKRSRTSAIPYQTPESINKVLKAISKTTLKKKFEPSINAGTKIVAKNKAVKPKSAKTSTTKLKKVSIKTISSPKLKPTPKKKKTTPKPKNAKKLNSINNKTSDSSINKTQKLSNVIKASKLKEEKVKKASKSKPKIEEPKIEEVSNKKRKSKKETLHPKNVALYEKDPTFYSNLEIPYISTLAQSRLVFRAVLMNDSTLLKKLVSSTELSKIYSLCIPRSTMGDKDSADALELAVKLGNKDAIKILLELDPALETKLGPSPDLLIHAESTGHNSRMMFGHGLRQVTVGRGGKEGHAALLKDEKLYNIGSRLPQQAYNFQHIIRGIEGGMPYAMVEFLLTLYKDRESSVMNELLENIDSFVRHGNVEVAGKLAARALKHGGYGYNFLHVESLTNTTEPFTAFKPVSVVKKTTSGSRFTPLHSAATNPNPHYLQTLLTSRPEYNLVDRQNWMPIHYAAVCVGDGPLKLLLSRGVSTLVTEKDGNTPLLLAVLRGRLQNVKAILSHEMQNVENNEGDGDTDSPKAAVEATSSLEKINRHGLRPLHAAAQTGNIEIVKALLKAKADPEKFTPAQHEKLTPLMIACLNGHLDVVKLLVHHGVKTAVVDRRGRTAIFHAVINGHSHVLSYLIRLGVNTEVKDSSGNTLAIYAAAYGWYFPLKLLLEAGCDMVKGNDWKLTPIAIAFMKGHIGIVEMLVKVPGVEVNVPVDGDSGE